MSEHSIFLNHAVLRPYVVSMQMMAQYTVHSFFKVLMKQ